jgi:hypothetical protein
VHTAGGRRRKEGSRWGQRLASASWEACGDKSILPIGPQMAAGGGGSLVQVRVLDGLVLELWFSHWRRWVLRNLN